MDRVAAYIGQIKDLPVLPEIAQRIIQLTDTDRPDVGKISALIQKDPAITANVLKLINSGYFALRREVTNLRQAVILLGIQQIRNLVVTMITVNHFKEPKDAHFKLSDFWNHSLGVATIAQTLGNKFSRKDSGDLYLAGLLHDIGKIIIQSYYPEDIAKVVRTIDKEKCSMFEAEIKVLQFSHADIGGTLAKLWKFPERIGNAIAYHHDCTKAPEPVFTAMLQFADLLTKARLYAVYGDQNTDIIFEEEPCWKIINKTFAADVFEDFERLLFEMDDEIEKARELVIQARSMR